MNRLAFLLAKQCVNLDLSRREETRQVTTRRAISSYAEDLSLFLNCLVSHVLLDSVTVANLSAISFMLEEMSISRINDVDSYKIIICPYCQMNCPKRSQSKNIISFGANDEHITRQCLLNQTRFDAKTIVWPLSLMSLLKRLFSQLNTVAPRKMCHLTNSLCCNHV